MRPRIPHEPLSQTLFSGSLAQTGKAGNVSGCSRRSVRCWKFIILCHLLDLTFKAGCVSLCMYVYLFVNLPSCMCDYLVVLLFVGFLVYLSLGKYICCLSFYLLVCLSHFLLVCLPLFVFFCQSLAVPVSAFVNPSRFQWSHSCKLKRTRNKPILKDINKNMKLTENQK